ncbi:MAG: hypothetical protein Q8M65_05815, partial [Rhodoglobus sp.]|nr:hypothetical protein [Rhodoglobus sp.]
MNAVPGAVAKGALLCGVVAMSVGGPLAIAQSASAAPGDVVEVSADGVTYGPTFPGSLFGAIRLVPGSSDTTTLWVRNPTSATAYLRVVLTEVVADDQDYWGALSVRTTVLGQVASMPMPSPSTCTVLATAVPMGAGQALPVIFALSLADLNGRQGQNGRADFAIGVTLSEVAYPTDCSTPAVVVPATPTTRS